MLLNLSQRSVLLVRSCRTNLHNVPSSIITSHSSTRKASTTSPDPMSFKLPSTESEVAELLASSKTPQERREIFQALLGTQSNPIPPLPSIPKSSSGVHLIPIGRKKLTTDHTGIQVHHSPFEALKETYSNTLKTLQNFPTASVYRQSVESLTQRNLEIVLKHEVGKAAHTSQEIEDSIKALEIELGVNLVEEAIDQAKDEHSLVLSLYDSEAWSDLIEKPSPGQWDSFTVPSSTSYPKD